MYKDPINNIPAFVYIMTCGRPGDKPLSAPKMIIYLTHIYASLGLNELDFNMSYVVPSFAIMQQPPVKKSTFISTFLSKHLSEFCHSNANL